MMKNRTVDIGVVEEKITQISQLFASELHILKIIKKTVAKLENFDLSEDEIIMLDKKRSLTMTLLEKTTMQRRRSQNLLVDYISTCSDLEVDKDYWCLFKHMSGAEMCAFESLQAVEPNSIMFSDFEDDLIRTSALFTETITLFLGLEVTDCASCLSDMLKGSEK